MTTTDEPNGPKDRGEDESQEEPKTEGELPSAARGAGLDQESKQRRGVWQRAVEWYHGRRPGK